MCRPSTIAIDGPAASGKSTLGYYLAQRLSYLYLDTGVLYRAVTWAALQHGVAITDEARITLLAEEVKIDVFPPAEEDGRQYTVRIGNTDITWAIRTPDVDRAVSPVSAYPGVRAALTRQMRRIAAPGHVVMVGRDIGTVVLPDADLKIYVVASAEARARRRLRDRLQQGCPSSYEQILQEIRRRDEIDSSREAAPLRPAEDAILFDTTALSIEQMLAAAEQLVDACACKASA
ncbi:MAG TPA: (d)CMP kinase [Anaerolineae bacterium]|nr:MAG: Cytidylate kinase [Chloroflexi bacterium ADurb.Bin222]HOC20358.1 (d)CMP kinase [Anaerolineae bacterium]HOS78862.1 (d)CMP kinase [Anaerolineae bacterium]HQJ11293.1 (d)CMP kinase [Anaerolineae bacterium]HQM14662.1 (d)CMP kinase [Anaerolineae bacterium]